MIGSQESNRPAGVGTGAAEAVDETVSAASDSARDVVSDASGMVSEAMDATRQNVAAGVRHATEFVSGVGGEAIAQVKRRPAPTVLLVAGAALVVGFIVGAATTKRG
ncbi:hypothetical protein DY023_06700 [Microbacterium bovistercoris]|uniref:Uncharacterized protein n=1 Tax=Microbacterium bovistercoris TaxID=2293570 RepID=A0A371NW81_9MICO|nr:hypothetical protein [Microbacterium bovistercoris]REJ06313.1 hypothetical protein DY023_06700 [Microbacterium bovistercoris]